MKGHRFPLVLCVMIIVGVLFGCTGPMTPTIEPPAVGQPIDYSLFGRANYVPLLSEEDPYPLYVGARWIYRNAAKYWNPQISSSGLLETEVVAMVQGPGEECYVLQTHYSNGPDELLYVHRAENAVVLRGHELDEAAGSQTTYSLNPGLVLLELPLHEDLEWKKPFDGSSVEAHVYHKEVVAIESGQVRTLLGSLPAIFLGSWRVHYTVLGASPRLFIGPEQFLWYAPGIGVVKHVLNSVDYELAEVRLPDEVLSLDKDDAGGRSRMPNRGFLVVQLRGGSPDLPTGSLWRLDAGGSLQFIDAAFYGDLKPSAEGSGTHVFRFRALEEGETVLRFVRFDQETGLEEDSVQFTIRVD
jgi:predicted secreted protein